MLIFPRPSSSSTAVKDVQSSQRINRYLLEAVSAGNRSVMLPDQRRCHYTTTKRAEARMATKINKIMRPFSPS